MNLDKMEEIAVAVRGELRRLGVDLEVVRDFRAAPALMEELGRPVGRANDPREILMTQTNSFWVVGRSTQSHHPTIGAGVRVDDLGCENAQEFLQRSVQVVFDADVVGVEDQMFGAQQWGRAAYVGALTSNLSTGLGRDAQRAVQLLMIFTQYRAFVDLAANVNYCFLRQSDHSKAISYGFLNAAVFPFMTSCPMYDDGNPGWIMTTRRDQLPSLMLLAARLMDQRFSVNEQFLKPVKIRDATGGQN